MIVIRFPDQPTERRALGYLAGRFPFTTWHTGEFLVPEVALAALAVEGLCFHVEGSATYGQVVPTLRDAAAVAVQ